MWNIHPTRLMEGIFTWQLNALLCDRQRTRMTIELCHGNCFQVSLFLVLTIYITLTLLIITSHDHKKLYRCLVIKSGFLLPIAICYSSFFHFLSIGFKNFLCFCSLINTPSVPSGSLRYFSARILRLL